MIITIQKELANQDIIEKIVLESFNGDNVDSVNASLVALGCKVGELEETQDYGWNINIIKK